MQVRAVEPVAAARRHPGDRLGERHGQRLARPRRHQVGVQHVREHLEAVDQPWARAREVRGGVDRHDLAGTDLLQLGAMVERLLPRAPRVVPARHGHDDVGLGGHDLGPRALLGVLTGQAEHVLAAGVVDELRRPVPGGVHRVQPFERGDAHRLGLPHGQPHAVDPAGRAGHELDALVAPAGGQGQRAHVAHDLAERVGVERDDLGLGLDPLRDRTHVLVGHGTHRAQRLGDDEVGLELGQQVLVEAVDGLAGLGELAHPRVDLDRGQALGDHAVGDVGELGSLGRVVALVGDGDHLVAEPEREEQLGGRGHEGHDPHGGQGKSSAADFESSRSAAPLARALPADRSFGRRRRDQGVRDGGDQQCSASVPHSERPSQDPCE